MLHGYGTDILFPAGCLSLRNQKKSWINKKCTHLVSFEGGETSQDSATSLKNPLQWSIEIVNKLEYYSFRTSSSARGHSTWILSSTPTFASGAISKTPWRRSFQKRIDMSPPRMSSTFFFKSIVHRLSGLRPTLRFQRSREIFSQEPCVFVMLQVVGESLVIGMESTPSAEVWQEISPTHLLKHDNRVLRCAVGQEG